jgi:hypothetical protein
MSLRNGNTGDIHNHILVMEKTLKDCDKPPIFALLMLAKVPKNLEKKHFL